MGQIWIRSPAAPTCVHPGCGPGTVSMERSHETGTPRQAPHAQRGDPVVWILAPISAGMRLHILQGNEPTFLLPLPRKAPQALPCVRTGGGPPVWRSWGWDLNPYPQTANSLAQRAPPFTACLALPASTCATRTHVHMHALTHRRTHGDVHTHRCTHRCTHREMRTHRCTHRDAHMERCTHTQVYTQMHTRRDAHTDVHTERCTLTGAHTETHTWRCTLTHRCTHTDAVILSPQAL